ncbi:hypothetical protein CBR_g34426 [Chara braunii]|uniref:Right handed beta helix domain-containing protein n=1 Tax=Chara braunii TaxID=69332 RepID=A0A388LIS7_CHABU|nr:hypothetical protein CBR_g34426 [Chara braunii]|eukprot:GBG82145.1 hypothetical protein CBR_g34426 [Chara braunii]
MATAMAMAMAACGRCTRLSATTAGSWLLLSIFLPLAAGYGLNDFLAALGNQDIGYHEVQGDVVLNGSLPPITSNHLTLVGRAPGGRRPVIDGAFESSHVTLVGKAPAGSRAYTLTLKNLEFVNFNGTQPIFSLLGHDIDIQDCIFRANRAIGGSGGSVVYIQSGNVKISRCFFIGNQAGTGGAVYSMSAGRVVIESTVFRDNQVTGMRGRGEGGGVYLLFADLYTISNCTFEGNQVDGLGGGMAAVGSSRGEIVGSSFLRNSAYSTERAYKSYATGGAIDIYGDNVTIISGCTFTGNKAEGRRGGAVSLSMYQAEVTISGSKFEQNAAGKYGGAVGVRLVTSYFTEAKRGVALYDGGPPRSRVKFCRGNTYSRNVAGTSGAENIYVDMRNSSVSGVTFCPSEPPLALIEAETGTVNITCASC